MIEATDTGTLGYLGLSGLSFQSRRSRLLAEVSAVCVEAALDGPFVRRLDLYFLVHGFGLELGEIEGFAALPHRVGLSHGNGLCLLLSIPIHTDTRPIPSFLASVIFC